MCEIDSVAEDWVDKGCHLHVGGVEIALRPDHLGRFVCRKCFSSTPDWQVDAAAKLVVEQLKDENWRRKLIQTLERAMAFLLGVSGEKERKARGRLREFRMLILALERWETW